MVLSPISTQYFVAFLHFLSPYPWHGQFGFIPSGEHHAVRDIAEAQPSLGPEPLLTLTCINMVVVFLTYLSLGVTILQRYKPCLPPRVAVRSRDQLGEAHDTADSMWSIKSGCFFSPYRLALFSLPMFPYHPPKPPLAFWGMVRNRRSSKQIWVSLRLKQNKNKTGQQKQDWELTVAYIMNSLLPNSDLNWRK